MQDPSYSIHQSLLPHLHLISSTRYPVIAALSVDQAFDYLIQAVKVVKEVAPMSWAYLQCPPDGAVFLSWQPLAQRGLRFASDGYVWADAESTYNYDVRGYTVEILVHRAGYRIGLEQVASHCRHRYRIVNKNPATAGLSYDPALSIVHYSQAEPQLRYPVNRIPLQPDVPRILQERRILESQGQLARKEFMLHDRYKWPTINPPHIGQLPPSGMAESQMHAPNASAMAAVGRHPQYYPQNQYAQFGPSPAKRPRQALQYSHPGAGGPAMHSSLNVGTDPGQDEEEYAAYGDLLDHLTPAEISRMRFVQHHVWMEELISSPYATNQIEPVDLGLGLMGELAELTNGVVDAAILNPPEDGPLGAPNSHRIKKVTASQLSEFERRVKKYSRDGAAELDRHAKEHAGRLASIKRSKAYLVAERKLRQEQTDEGGGQDSAHVVEKVVRDIERRMGVTIKPRQDIVCIDKGGYTRERKESLENLHELLQLDLVPLASSDVNVPDAKAGAAGQAGRDYIMDGQSLQTTGSDHLTTTKSSVEVTMMDVLPSSEVVEDGHIAHVDVFSTSPPPPPPLHDSASVPETAQPVARTDSQMAGIQPLADADWIIVQADEGQSPMQQFRNATAGQNEKSLSGEGRAVEAETQAREQESSSRLAAGESVQDASAAATLLADAAQADADALVDFSAGGTELDLALEASAFGDAFHDHDTIG